MPRTDAFVYDPTRSDFQADAHAIYRVLRDEHPVYHDPVKDVWALSRFGDVRDAATDTATFSSENTDITVGLLPQIQSMDPPRHDALRNLVSRAFTGRRADAMEPRIRTIARRLIGEFAGRGASRLDNGLDFRRRRGGRAEKGYQQDRDSLHRHAIPF